LGIPKYRDEIESALQALDDFENGTFTFKKPRNLYKVTLHKGKQPGEYNWLHWDQEPTPDLLKKAGMEGPPFPVWTKKQKVGFHDYWDLDGHGYVIENSDTGWFDYYPLNNYHGAAKTLEYAKKEVESYVRVQPKFLTSSALYYALGSKLYSQAKAEADQYFEDLRRKHKIGQRDSVLENLSDQERAKMDALNDKAAMEPDQLASLFLLSQGIDGVKYPTGTLSQYNPFSQDQRRALASQIYKKDPSLPHLVERIMSNDNNYATIERLLTKNFGESEAKRMIDAAGARPTFNYVVFDESAITIDEHTQFRVRPEEDEADHEKSWTAATMLSLKEFGTAFMNPKAGFVKSKEDTTVIDRLISTPSHYFNKVPAAQRMYEGALRFPDNQQAYVNAITKSKMNGDYFTTRLEKLNKDLPEEYTALKDYLVSKDMNQVGFSVKQDDSGKFYTVLDPKGVTVGRVVSENGAWTLAITEEAKRYRDEGSSEQAAQALIGFRAMMHNGFNILYTNIRQTIARLEALGLDLPEVAVWSSGAKVQVNLKQALQMMGDLRGYYFPRQRAPGRFMVTGERKDGARFMDFRDMKITAQKLVNKLTLKGYDASYSKSPALPEDVFEMARSTVAIQAEINAALGRIKQKAGVTLEDFGLKRVEFITDTMKASFANYDISLTDNDFLVTGPWNKDMTPVFKAMGGKWYRAERVWHFYNPPKNFEQRLASALLQKVNIVDRQMAILFAKNLTEQAANVLKARGHRVHMIQRTMAKGQEVWKGYETDPARSAANYASGLAAGESKRILAADLVAAMTGTDYTWEQYKDDRLEFDEKPDYSEYLKVIEKRRIDPASQKNAFKDAKIYMEDLLRNNEWIDRFIGGVKGVAVLKYLGGRVSAPIVNLTAMVTSVPACMNGFANISPGAIAPLLTSAANHYTRYKLFQKTGIPADVINALDYITNKGWDKSQYNKEALSVLEGKLKGGWRKLLEYSMMAFGASEQLNRASTILGTFMGIKAQGGDFNFTQAMELAKRVSDQAHGVYGKINYPFMARGSNPAAQLIKSFYVFRTFSHNYLLTMKDLWGHSWKPEHAMAFNFMLISPAIVAGTGASIATPIIAALFKMAGLGGDDPEEDLYAWISANLGEYTEELTRFGLFGMAGVSLKGSLQIGITDIPTTIPEVLGAPGSMVTDLAYGAESIIRGDVSKGFEKILPLFAGNVLKGIRESTEGVTTGSNAPVFYGKEPLVADTIDAILRSMSFNPSRIAAIREKQWSERKVEAKYREIRSDIYAKFKRFYLAPKKNRSKADYIDLLSEVRQYNARVKDRGLTAKGIPFITKQAIKNNLKRAFRPTKRERLRKTNP
ncbi:MAG: hypothetical protein MIO92_05305, partial [Methanosarcinaceae archaeon]|nr:hypothetical protein [Methanosarcinaceae archaeon]